MKYLLVTAALLLAGCEASQPAEVKFVPMDAIDASRSCTVDIKDKMAYGKPGYEFLDECEAVCNASLDPATCKMIVRAKVSIAADGL